MSSLNERALRRLIALAILSGVVIIALFCVIEQAQIRSRALTTLENFAAAPLTDTAQFASGRISPEIAAIDLDEPGTVGVGECGKALLAHVREVQPTDDTIHHFSEGRLQAYYFVQSGEALGLTADAGTYLFYTDVSFAADVVHSAALIMALVFCAVAALIYFVGRATIRLLDRKDQGMRDFFAAASHELKTPLMAIRSYADGLQTGIVDQPTACHVIDKECDRMGQLIGDILAFSKLDSGMVEPHLAENDLREILYDAVQSIEPSTTQRGLALQLSLAEPMLLRCDEGLLFSVFSNVLSNNVRYATQSISLSAERAAAPWRWHVAIVNDGPPIPPDAQAHIFDRFYKGADGQTGLGLALSREYVELHKGRITVSSENQHTTFDIYL